MNIVSYGVKLHHLSKALDPTIKVYRDAVAYLMDIVFIHYDEIKNLKPLSAQRYIEVLVHTTKNTDAIYKTFDQRFYKFPSYLRRDAINTAIGKVDSYKKLLALRDSSKGKKPHINRNQDMMPCFYREGMFRQKENEFSIKIFQNNDWVWLNVHLDKTDLDYIKANCIDMTECAPALKKAHKAYVLQFAYKYSIKDRPRFKKDVDVTQILAIDLGINTDAVCTVIKKDGTVTGQKFIDHPVEKDRLYTLLNIIKGAQQHGSRKMPRLWGYVNNYNREIAVKTASAITEYAVSQNVDVIVFENLSDLKANGSKRQRISLWRKRDIQHRTETMASRFGIRVSYICPKNTSHLAYDGSGEVKRDNNNFSLCTFKSGKRYNCDLSASKNIGARYFIRAIKKSIPATDWLQLQAKVPELCTRTQCTLSTLINLSAVNIA